jgi:hypothetical protein
MKTQWPDFLVIGAGKAGTTALYHRLAAHPQLFMSPVKEPNFFALEGASVPACDHSPEQTEHYPWSITEEAAYRALFADAPAGCLKGEASPMYLYSEKACRNIARRLPQVKLIAMLRQPADRLYSRYLHLAREARAPAGGLEAAFDADSIWRRRNDLVPEGYYGRYLERYFRCFEREQILVLFYEDWQKRPTETLARIAGFLGVAHAFPPAVLEARNVSGIVRRPRLHRWVGPDGRLPRALAATSPQLVRALRRNRFAQRLLDRVRRANLARPPLDPALRRRLTERLYGHDLALLESLLQQPLHHWKV